MSRLEKNSKEPVKVNLFYREDYERQHHITSTNEDTERRYKGKNTCRRDRTRKKSLTMRNIQTESRAKQASIKQKSKARQSGKRGARQSN